MIDLALSLLTYITEVQLGPPRNWSPVECFQDQPDSLRGRIIVVVRVDREDFHNNVLLAASVCNTIGECPTTVD